MSLRFRSLVAKLASVIGTGPLYETLMEIGAGASDPSGAAPPPVSYTSVGTSLDYARADHRHADIVVADLDALFSYDTANFGEGVVAYVETVRDFWTFTNLSITNNNITAINSAVNGSWVRQCIPHVSWRQQPFWFLDGTNGDDENVGDTDLVPLRTFGELQRRLCVDHNCDLLASLDIEIVTPPTDQLNIFFRDPDKGGWFAYIHGRLTESNATTVNAFTAAAGATSTQGLLVTNDAAFYVPGEDGRRWVVYPNAGPAYSLLMFAGANDRTAYSRRYTQFGGLVGSNPAPGEAIAKVEVPLINVERLGADFPNNCGVEFLQLQQYPNVNVEIQGCSIVNCTVSTASLTNCVLIDSALIRCRLYGTTEITPGQIDTSNNVIQGGQIQTGTMCFGHWGITTNARISSIEAVGQAGLIVASGRVLCSGGQVPDVAGTVPGTVCIEVRSGGVFRTTAANALFGGSRPIVLKPGGILERSVINGVSNAKPGTAITWPDANLPVTVAALAAAVAPTMTGITAANNTWGNATGYTAAANTNILHLHSGARIVTAAA